MSYASDECNCRVCNNDDAPDLHEVCECYDCHEADCHDNPVDWAGGCQWCDELLVERALEEEKEAENERSNDLQKGDSL